MTDLVDAADPVGAVDPGPVAIDPIVDAERARPFDSVERYTAAIERIPAAAAAYYGGPDLAMDDATYDALLARVAAAGQTRNRSYSNG